MDAWNAAPWVGGLLSLGCLLAAFRNYRRKALIEALPTSRALGVFIGLVEMKGAAECEKPLRSYLAGLPCVYYAWEIEEQWQSQEETGSGSDRRTETRQGWTSVGKGEEFADFYVKDATGAILVRPDGADFDAPSVLSRTCGRDNPIYIKGPPDRIPDSTGLRRFSERAIRLHGPAFVVGKARERRDAVAAEIAADADAPLFLVSGRSEEQVRRSYFLYATLWSLGGLALLVGGFEVQDYALGRGFNASTAIYKKFAFAYLGAWLIAWVWNVFNDLISLKNRVREGWGLIDIQLKRRHDLIPRLVTIAQALRDHESAIQEQLALLRSQASGKQKPAQERALRPALRVMLEKYPPLQALPAFRNLQQGIIETEERIALARDYYNAIATHFNTRTSQFPHGLVAMLIGARNFPLLSAQDFERAPVAVDFSK